MKNKNEQTQLEIERRWILKEIPAKIKNDSKAKRIYQVYLKSKDGIAQRVRETWENGKATYESCVKEPVSHGVVKETEMKISKAQFMLERESLFKSGSQEIRKTRFSKNINGLVFEFDKFYAPEELFKVSFLEIELSDISQELPNFEKLGIGVVAEVTGMKEFSNMTISTNPEKTKKALEALFLSAQATNSVESESS